MKRLCLLLAVLAIVPAVTPGSAQTKSLKIGLAKSEANFVFLSARRGAEAKAAALSKQLGAAISVAWLTPQKEDAAVQAELIRKAVKDKVDAILLSASDGPALVSVVNEAVEAGGAGV